MLYAKWPDWSKSYLIVGVMWKFGQISTPFIYLLDVFVMRIDQMAKSPVQLSKFIDID